MVQDHLSSTAADTEEDTNKPSPHAPTHGIPMIPGHGWEQWI